MESTSPIVLVSCGNRKLDAPAPAKDLYVSPRFQEARKFAENYGDSWFVVSAKHGLTAPEEVLTPYDVDLRTLSTHDRRKWAVNVLSKLSEYGLLERQFVVLAGEAYSKAIEGAFEKRHVSATYPLRDLPEDKEADILARVNGSPLRMAHYKRFYDLLLRLQNMSGQMIPFSKLGGKQMSKAGVYFFFDPHEYTRFYEHNGLRVVRIGTHGVSKGSKSLLWQRLRTHRGNDDGTGSHRSSIFRLHVGNAILASQDQQMPSWGLGDNASKETRDSEQQLEMEVSQYLKELLVAYLPVVDAASADSDRSYIERNAIALLSGGGAIDVQSKQWLGNFSPTHQIKSSGLWNVNYVGEGYDADFLAVFEALIECYEQGRLSDKSIAPPNWRSNLQRGAVGQQELF